MDDQHSENEEASDLRNYLATFQKEIEGDEVEETDSLLDQDSEEEAVNGDLYGYISPNEFNPEISIKEEPDEELELLNGINTDGYDYIRDSEIRFEDSPKKKGAEIIRLGSRKYSKNVKDESSDAANDSPTSVSTTREELHEDDKHALEMVAHLAEQAVANASKNSELSVTETGGAYQTVTIVPSDTNPGELSYVLFVSEADDLDKNVIEGSIPFFDVNDPTQFSETFLTEQLGKDGVKMRAIRLAPRKSALVTQQHSCTHCSYSSPKRYLLSRHMKSHSDERPHKCGVCERGFKTLASLQNHVNTHTGTRPHPCKECESCFTTSGELVRHVRYKHTHEKPHKCTECDYASVELSKLKRHMRCHTGERPYQCPHCTYASPDTYKLKRHLRIHTGEKPYECDICQTRFTQSNSLKAHKLIHSGNKPIFRCEYCPATCGRKTDLRIHMEKLHSSDKPHRCKRCGKIFLDRYSYKIHTKSHDGEKCYKCDLCDYASISQRHLETHMFVHTDQKPFQCDVCDQSFRQKQLLKRHKNIYHNPNYIKPEPKEKNHVCALCSKAFRHKGNLIRHLTLHDPDASAIDKEIAMSLDDPKESGQDEYGEEDENDEFGEKGNQQVVVFEVIQLPGSHGIVPEAQTITMLDGQTVLLNGNETQEYSIIQKAEELSDMLLSQNTPESEGKSNVKLENGSSRNKISPRKKGKYTRSKTKFVNLKKDKTQSNKQVNVLKVSADKSVPHSQSLPLLPLDDKSMFEKDNDLHKTGDEEIQKEFDDCFGFDDEEDLLITSTNPVYETFDTNIEHGIS